MSCPHEAAGPSADSGADVRTTLLTYAGTRAGVSTAPVKQPSSHGVRGLPSHITQRKGTSACHGKGKHR